MTVDIEPGDILTVAKTLWGEARGEGLTGMFAVACVIRNRAERPGWWGRGWTGVCRKPWQFSCWNEGDPNWRRFAAFGETSPELKDALAVAREVMTGHFPDITQGANHYHTQKVKPNWSRGREPEVVIGNHLFFNL